MIRLCQKLYFFLVVAQLSSALPRLFGGGESANTAAEHTSNKALLFFNVLLVSATLYYAFPVLPRLWRALLQLRWTFLLYLWMILSVGWSVDRSTSFRSGIYGLLYLLSAAYFAYHDSTEELLERLQQSALAGALLSIAGEFVLPPTEDLAPGWSGIFVQKNALGLCMMLGIAVMLMQQKRWSFLRLCHIGLYTALLVLSQSSTAILATAVVLFFVVFQHLGGRSKVLLWMTVGCTGVVLSLLLPDAIGVLLGAGGKTSSFTGRDVIWAFALKGILEHPMLGHGYAAFWAGASDTIGSALSWNPHHAHNGVLQICLDLGLVGLVLALGLLINTLRRALRLRRYDRSKTSFWMLALLLIAFVHNTMESDLMATNMLWYLLMLGSFACLRAEEQARAAPRLARELAADAPELVTA